MILDLTEAERGALALAAHAFIFDLGVVDHADDPQLIALQSAAAKLAAAGRPGAMMKQAGQDKGAVS